MGYLCELYVRDVFPSERISALFSGETGTELTSVLEIADAEVYAALLVAGHDIPPSTYSPTTVANNISGVPSVIRLCALGAFLEAAYSRKTELEPPAVMDRYLQRLDQLRDGRLPVPDLTPDPETAPGGTMQSSRSSTSAAGKSKVFDRTTLEGW